MLLLPTLIFLAIVFGLWSRLELLEDRIWQNSKDEEEIAQFHEFFERIRNA